MLTRRVFLKNMAIGTGAIALAPKSFALPELPIQHDVIEKIGDGIYRGSKGWEECDFYEIVGRLTKVVSDLMIQSKATFTPSRDCFFLRTPYDEILAKVNAYGKTVGEWIQDVWTEVIVVSESSPLRMCRPRYDVVASTPDDPCFVAWLGSGDNWKPPTEREVELYKYSPYFIKHYL